jgi:hypothetical protein
MKRIAALVVLGLGPPGVLACEQPTPPMIPEAVQSEQELTDLSLALQTFRTDIEAYIECIRAEFEAAGGEAAPEPMRTLLILRNNQAVEEVRSINEITFRGRTGAAGRRALSRPQPTIV